MLINKITEELLEGYISSPNATLLLKGGGSGSSSLGLSVADRLLGKNGKNNIVICEPIDGKSIGVQQIRELKQSLSTKTMPSGGTAGRVALIKEAGTMTIEAQNGLLKLIEEPPSGTVILLCESATSSNLIKTIRSRCLEVRVLPVTRQQGNDYAKQNNITQQDMDRHMLMSKGDPELLMDLIEGKDNDAADNIAAAKSFLSKAEISRIADAKTYAKKPDLVSLLAGVTRTSEAAMHKSQNNTAIAKWANVLRVSLQCEKLLSRSVQPKLVYLKLCINI